MINKLKKIIDSSDTIIITAGAGIGVDSGLPDFRSNNGFWKQDIKYIQLANPKMFRLNEEMAWEFYIDRLKSYRETIPHKGFNYMLDYINKNNKDYFVVTSNVDEQFQKAGYDPEKILEIHGSIHNYQCLDNCCTDIWRNEIDEIPRCKKCDETARPNILLFNDWEWNSTITDKQEERYLEWMDKIEDSKICIIEIGAGTEIPSIRYKSEHIFEYYENTNLIRINLNDVEIPDGAFILQETALSALTKLFK